MEDNFILRDYITIGITSDRHNNSYKEHNWWGHYLLSGWKILAIWLENRKIRSTHKIVLAELIQSPKMATTRINFYWENKRMLIYGELKWLEHDYSAWLV